MVCCQEKPQIYLVQQFLPLRYGLLLLCSPEVICEPPWKKGGLKWPKLLKERKPNLKGGGCEKYEAFFLTAENKLHNFVLNSETVIMKQAS